MPSLLSRLSTLRPGKTWIALGAALAIGMIAALSAKGYLSRQMAAMEALGHGVGLEDGFPGHSLEVPDMEFNL